MILSNVLESGAADAVITQLCTSSTFHIASSFLSTGESNRMHVADSSKIFQIKEFALNYEAPNEKDTFSVGDVTGTVTFTLKKDTKVKSPLVKVKGDVRVHRTEGTKDNERTYSDHRRYFKVKEHLVTENASGRTRIADPLICLSIFTQNLFNSFYFQMVSVCLIKKTTLTCLSTT